jgi:hypothetical protein
MTKKSTDVSAAANIHAADKSFTSFLPQLGCYDQMSMSEMSKDKMSKCRINITPPDSLSQG